jgi:serine-type D-Ala-D-Ala carboxypeptidase (penicillin-binding protein 5/6)
MREGVISIPFMSFASLKNSHRVPIALVFAAVLLPGVLQVRAQSAVMVVDAYNRKVHVANQGNQKRPVGGLAKIVTTMVALDWAEASKVGVNVLATVPEYATRIAGVASPDLQIGDQVTVRDLIYATMMTSDNVAAITLGHFVGTDLLSRLGKGGDPLGEFVKQMNALAIREGAKGTRFMNPHGYENTRPIGGSTAADIARVALYASARPSFRFYTNQRSRKITIYRGGQPVAVTLGNTNQLLGVDRIDGIKTGNTPSSGGCVVISAERPANVAKQADGSNLVYRHRMVVVVLGSGNPFAEARALLGQGWQAYDQWLRMGRPVTDRKQMLSDF